MSNESGPRAPSGSESESAPKKRPYAPPRVVTRPLFERMALTCIDPDTGDPIEGGPS